MHFKTNYNLSLRTFIVGFKLFFKNENTCLPISLIVGHDLNIHPTHSLALSIKASKLRARSGPDYFQRTLLLFHMRGSCKQPKESPNPLSWIGPTIVGPRLGSAQDQANGRRTGRSYLVGLHGCSQVLTKHNSTGHQHCRNYHEHCLENAPLSVLSNRVWHLSWFIVYWYGLRLVSWAVAFGYFSRLSSRSCSTWLTFSSTWSILLLRLRRWSLQAWKWWATKDNMSFLKKMN